MLLDGEGLAGKYSMAIYLYGRYTVVHAIRLFKQSNTRKYTVVHGTLGYARFQLSADWSCFAVQPLCISLQLLLKVQ